MKSNWNRKRLSDIAILNPKESIVKGCIAKKISMDMLRPFCRDILEYDETVFSGGVKFRNGDTIMARITPCLENGKTAKISILNKNEVGFGSTEYIVFRAINGECDEDYLYYLICSPIVRKPAIKSMVGTSGRQRVQTDVIKNLELLVPKIDEQKRIGKILRSLDDKIFLNSKINQNLLQEANTLWYQLRDKSNCSFASINDIALKVAMGPFGSNIKVETFVPAGVPIISGNHLRGYFLEDGQYNYISESHAAQLKNSNVYPHDIIFTHAGNIGQVAMIPENSEYKKYILSQRQFYLRCNKQKVFPEYVLFFFHSAEGQYELLSYANQTGVPSIAQPASNLKKIQFPLPTMAAQERWMAQIEPLLKLYLCKRKESQHLSVLRDLLLPKLMSGELDVSSICIQYTKF